MVAGCLANVSNVTDFTIFTINNISYGRAFECPKGENCYFTCSRHFAACMHNVIVCAPGSFCRIDCLSTISCSFLEVRAENATVELNCWGKGACSFLMSNCTAKKGCLLDASNQSAVKMESNFLTTVGLLFTKAFAWNGYEVANTYVTSEGTVQILGMDWPQDNETLTTLFAQIKTDMVQVVYDTNIVYWRDYPDFTLGLSHPLVISAFFDPNAALKQTIRNAIVDYSAYLSVVSANYSAANSTIDVVFQHISFVPYNLAVTYLRPFMEGYAVGIFRYPNASYVEVNFAQLPSYRLECIIRFFNHHCSYPAPFYGTYCWGTEWFSEGEITIDTADLIATSTTHTGTLNVDNTLSVVEGGSLTTGSDLVVSSDALLTVSQASIHVGNTLNLSDSTIQLSAGANVSAHQISLGANSNLVIVLSEDQMQQFETTGYISISAFDTDNITGSFTYISFSNGNGTVDGCLQTTYEKRRVVVSLLSSCSKESQQLTVITLAVVLPVVGLILIIAAVVLYFQRQAVLKEIMGTVAASKPDL
eukprot:TRINITY_DN11385_c0_g1_i2.p1 TRINITY_DN11385_c0_g1~~TRINITY_DN11385_c0_g1_i2.p1  ORF type:complete len:549 (+),score=39.22 TRINITY_DN11385_c0_g1_i2:51-1649(+)